MISNIRRGALVASGVFCLAAAGIALAQPAPPPPAADTGPPGAGMHHWRDPAPREAERAQRLSEILQLRPDQQGALHAFLDASLQGRMDHDGMGGRHDLGDGQQGQTLTTPQRLDAMLAHFDEMRAHLVARVEATKTFYAQLTPPQQQAFDAMRGGFGHHDHGDGGGRDGRGPGGPGGESPGGGPPG